MIMREHILTTHKRQFIAGTPEPIEEHYECRRIEGDNVIYMHPCTIAGSAEAAERAMMRMLCSGYVK